MNDSLGFMLFGHEPALLEQAREAGIERVVVDWETRNKTDRQSGYHLEQNHLSVTDLAAARKAFPDVLVCRINPIHDNSRNEIDCAIDNGADVLMLPMFKTVLEVDTFWRLTAERVKTMLLFETRQSISVAATLGERVGEAYVGLNDMGISMGQQFAFQLLESDIVESIRRNLPKAYFGFGALTLLTGGVPLQARLIMTEMARLRCNTVILRRAFKRDIHGRNWRAELDAIRNEYRRLLHRTPSEIEKDRVILLRRIREIVS